MEKRCGIVEAVSCDGSVLSWYGSINKRCFPAAPSPPSPRCVIAIVKEIPSCSTVALLGTDNVTSKMIPMMVC